MKGYARTIMGIEEISIKEINQILKTKAEILFPGILVFEADSTDQIAELAYLARSLIRTGLFITSGKFSSLEDIKKQIEKAKIRWEHKTFAVRCHRNGNHNFSSKEIEKEIGSIIPGKADLTNPHTLFIVEINNNGFMFGIDFCGFDLDKRPYRVKMSYAALNSCIAYAMISLNSKTSIIDPYCRDGIILIENALCLTNTPPNYLQKERFQFNNHLKFNFSRYKPKKTEIKTTGTSPLIGHIKNSKINTSMSEMKITLMQREFDWLPTLFQDKEVNLLSFPPYPSKKEKKQLIDMFYNNIFDALDIIKDRIILNTHNEIDSLITKKKGIRISKKITYHIGGLKNHIYVLEKNI